MSGLTIDQIMGSHKIIICVGSGGVGKTTLSASLGVWAAQRGRRVLVMTIDPSMRLKEALGLVGESHRPVEVPGQSYKGALHAQVLNAEEIFREFILGSSSDPAKTNRLLSNRLYQQLSTTLSGSQEFTSLLRLSKIVNEDRYDLIILDTPPAQHAVDFLEAPEKISALFQEGVVRWFIGGEEVGFFRKMVSQGTRTVLSVLEKITGSRFMSELNDFFSSVKSVQGQIEEKMSQVKKLLGLPTTGFFLVTGFDAAKLREAEVLNGYLQGRGHHLVAALINRAYPKWAVGHEKPHHPELEKEYQVWAKWNKARETLFIEFAQKWSKKLPVVRIPDLNKEVSGLRGLEVVSNEMDLSFRYLDDAGL